MTPLENSTASTNRVCTHFVQQNRYTIISVVVLALLASFAIALCAWSNVKIASIYGSATLLQCVPFTTLLPMAAFALIVAVIAIQLFLRNPRRETESLNSSNSEAEPVTTQPTTSTIIETVEDPEKLVPMPAAPVPSFHQTTAPMPGSITRIAVKVGDQVKRNDVLCVLEAMKMEMVIRSDVEGKVSEILAKENEALKVNQPILSIELKET